MSWFKINGHEKMNVGSLLSSIGSMAPGTQVAVSLMSHLLLMMSNLIPGEHRRGNATPLENKIELIILIDVSDALTVNTDEEQITFVRVRIESNFIAPLAIL